MPPPGAPEQVAQAGLELLRVERGQAEVVEQVLAELELGELRARHEQQQRLERQVALAQRAAQRERALGVVVGDDDARRPSRRPARAASATRSLPTAFHAVAGRGRASARARAAAGRGRREAVPSALDVARVRSEPREVAVELERGDLRLVRPSTRSRLLRMKHSKTCSPSASAHELRPLHHVERLGQRLGQRRRCPRPRAPRSVSSKMLSVASAGQLVALLDALQAGGEHHREREVRVAGRVGRAELDAGRARLALLGIGGTRRGPTGCCAPSTCRPAPRSPAISRL